MADTRNDSHLSQGSREETPTGPLRQHQRLARGEKLNGQSNPNGASTGPTNVRVGNSGGKTY